jgi:hypothetical protein
VEVKPLLYSSLMTVLVIFITAPVIADDGVVNDILKHEVRI